MTGKAQANNIINRGIAMFKKASTVDQIVKTLDSQRVALLSLSDKLAKEAAQKRAEAAKLEAAATRGADEASRASRVAQRVADLVS